MLKEILKQSGEIYKMNSMKERYIATLVGCALGDTLGMPVEGWKREQIKKYVGEIKKPIEPVKVFDEDGNLIKEDEFGKLKYYLKGLSKGDYTDDTALTLALAESIVETGRINIVDIARKHIKEYDSCLEKSVVKGFGCTTKDAINNLKSGISPLESGVIGGPGNGPAMKMSPIGLFMDVTGLYDYGMHFAELVSKMTHLDTRSIASGVMQAHSIFALLQDIQRDNFVDMLPKVCLKYEKPLRKEFKGYHMGDLTSRLIWVRDNKDVSCDEAHNYLGSSSNVLSSYPFTLFMFQKFWNDPITGLIETVNYGGDCDTTGAIYGALCGAKNGMIFPEEWVKELKEFERLKAVAEKLYSLEQRKEYLKV